MHSAKIADVKLKKNCLTKNCDFLKAFEDNYQLLEKDTEIHLLSDAKTANWISAAANFISSIKNSSLEEKIDKLINKIEKSQWVDGYINIYFTTFSPEKRWSNIAESYELYSAGCLIEAAISHYKATKKDKFLNIVCNYADHINSIFGEHKGKLSNIPQHPKIEIELINLYSITNNKNYLNLAEFFIKERENTQTNDSLLNRINYYSAVCKLYGENKNSSYLKKCQNFFENSIKNHPHFSIDESISFISFCNIILNTTKDGKYAEKILPLIKRLIKKSQNTDIKILKKLTVLNTYFYSCDKYGIYLNIYTDSTFSNNKLNLKQYSNKEKVQITINCKMPIKQNIALRISHEHKHYTVKINGKKEKYYPKKGYIYINRIWKNNDEIILILGS